ncbi:MAG: AmmeMemoRadiSam system protein B [Rhodospirillales bacterium]|nr:AmmeMemoRadiSam system protein B [Rhodospirillales bacterium]MBO6786268.1 AmmeMemoRadiSam system protein B [Rhodospirillales bacterium]
MTAIRKAAVAGMFYPGSARELSAEVQEFLRDAGGTDGPAPKAIIAPHAGYKYSGAVAAKVYARLKPVADKITRVVLLGPCHRVAVRGLALSGADYFETPLGRIEIDKDAERRVAELEQVGVFPPTHQAEHSLEVHLPFLQELLGDFKLVPIVVGETPPEKVAEVLTALWGGPETLIVISSDLSHFLDYDSAQQIDQRTCEAITALDPGRIEKNGACGRFPVGGLLQLAKTRGMKVETIDLRNSGDTAGTKDRVVGYGAWAFYDAPAAKSKTVPLNIRLKRKDQTQPRSSAAGDFEQQTKQLLTEHGTHLLALADRSIRFALEHGKPMSLDLKAEPAALQAQGASFVTLKTAAKQLRGCIGSPMAHQPLALDVAANAYKAAFKDPRFNPVSADEYETLHLSISVLSPQAPMEIRDEADLIAQLRPGIDGLVIADGGRRALFLPAVWEQLPDPKLFLAHLKRKAGMAENHWSDGFRANRFIAEEIHAGSGAG